MAWPLDNIKYSRSRTFRMKKYSPNASQIELKIWSENMFYAINIPETHFNKFLLDLFLEQFQQYFKGSQI